MKIIHASDTHDNLELIAQIGKLEGDLILLTGDLLDNRGRINHQGIIFKKEVHYQKDWLFKHKQIFLDAFQDREVAVTHGNHDFINIVKFFRDLGYPKIHSLENNVFEFQGLRFGGFRNIPYIEGEWAGETLPCFFKGIVDSVLDLDLDVLVTHAPCAGVLDGAGYGIPALTSALQFRQHRIKHHFFGHTHEHGGVDVEVMGIHFYNGACDVKVHQI